MLIVLVIFFIITIIGTAMLSLTLSSYKVRVLGGNIKTNMYLSEAGLDEAYGLLSKEIDSAVNSGNTSVDNFMASLDLSAERKKALSGTSPYINADGSTNVEAIKNMQNQVFQGAFQTYFLSNRDLIRNKIQDSSNYKISLDDVKPSLSVKTMDNAFSNLKWNIAIQSTFQHKDVKKTLSADYVISTPDYNRVYYVSSKVVNISDQLIWSKAITIDGDMNINSANVQVDGDIYVKGNGSSSNPDGGIAAIGPNSSLAVNGIVSTNKAFESNSTDSNLTVNGNIYAFDVGVKKGADRSNILVNGRGTLDGSVYTKNDLALNGLQSHINILGGYYGLNDGSDQPDPDKSSSIKINSSDLGMTGGSTLAVAKNSYILGTSYVLTDQKYQTGESVSVKGNYMAYASPLNSSAVPDKYKEANVKFAYYNPLRFVSEFNNSTKDPLLVQDKANYFKYYQQEYGTNSGLNLGQGISLPDSTNIKHTGAIVSNGQIYLGNLTLDDNSTVLLKQNELKKMLYELGANTSDDLSKVNDPQKTVSNQVDFSKVQNRVINTINSDGNIIISNNDSNATYALVGPGGDTSSIPLSAQVINVGNNPIKGIILTRGDVYMSGSINFTGTIIAQGDLNITDTNIKKITYDKAYLEKLIAYNNSLFKDVFVSTSDDTTKNVEISSQLSGDNTVGTDLVRNQLITMKNWTIEK